jgi:hypothetical protein
MSSSDYTNLRRIRHIYYPTISNTTGCNTNAVSGTASYIVPSTVPVTYAPSYACPPTYACPPIYACPPTTCPTTTCSTTCSDTTNTCCTQTTPTTTVANTVCDNRVVYQNPLGYFVEQILPDKTSIVTTAESYLITPQKEGTASFIIDKCLSWVKGMFVSVVSDLSGSNYFEAEVYSYSRSTGLLQLYNLDIVTGTFTDASTYTISIIPAYKEMSLLRQRMIAVYASLFNQDISDPNASTGSLSAAELSAATTLTSNYYLYLFGVALSTVSGYSATEAFLTTTVNDFYSYFFDVDLTASANSSYNPNNNGVVMSTLTIKLEQFGLYFFDSRNPTIVAS